MSTPAPANTIHCLLCGGTFLFPGPRYAAHLLNEHGVVYDIDFLIQVSKHKKSFSSLPLVPQPVRISESSSQTKNEALCCNCCSTHEDLASRVESEALVDSFNTHWNGQVHDDVNYEDEELTYEVNQDQSEYLVIKPDIDTDVGASFIDTDVEASFFNPKNSSKVTLSSDMQCYFNCGEVFKKGYDLQLHIKLRHKGEDPLELARAEEAAKFEIALTRRSGCVYRCVLCDKTVEGGSSFWEHIRKHKISLADYKAQYGKCEIESASFQCRICEKVLKHEKNTIHKHLQGVHGINWTQYLARVRQELSGIKQEPLPDVMSEQCQICHLQVKYLKLHLKNRHGIVKKVRCLLCDESFKYFKTHLKNKHGITGDEYDQVTSEAAGDNSTLDWTKKVSCQICGESFKYFKTHLKNKHGITSVEYDQVTCEAGNDSPTLDFNQNSDLLESSCSLPASSDPVAKSNLCDSSSMSPKKNLSKPSKEEMSDKTVKYCSVCEIQFVTRKLFIDHCQISHNVRFKTKAHGFLKMSPPQPQVPQSSLSQVKLFDSTSPNSFDITRPSKVSKIVWPVREGSLVCEVCGDKFTSWRHLDQHMKLNCKRVACESCEKTYSSLNNLKKHRKFSCIGNNLKLDPVNIAKEIVEQIISTVFSVSQGPHVVFKCPVENCGQHFGRSVHLRRHLSNYHN